MGTAGGNAVIARLWDGVRDRLLASAPGVVRLRLRPSGVLGIVVTVAVLAPLGQPLPSILVAAIGAMMSAFTVNDPRPRQQAMTLLLAVFDGACSMSVAALGLAAPPLNSIVFILLIFVAVYAQRFGSRGVALGSMAFFLF